MFPFHLVSAWQDVLAPAVGAGQLLVGGTTRVRAQPRYGTHTPSRVRLVEVESPDPAVKDVVLEGRPGGEEYPELPHRDGSGVVWQGDHGKVLDRVNALEVL